MQDSIISQEWCNYQLPTYKNDKVVGISYSGKLIMQTAEYLLPSEDGNFSISGSTDTTWAGVGLSKTDEEVLAGEGKSPLRNSVAVQQMLDAVNRLLLISIIWRSSITRLLLCLQRLQNTMYMM